MTDWYSNLRRPCKSNLEASEGFGTSGNNWLGWPRYHPRVFTRIVLTMVLALVVVVAGLSCTRFRNVDRDGS